MDDESKQLLREIRDIQQKQLELLKATAFPAWLRFRFKLSTFLLATMAVALIVGIAAAIYNFRK